MASSSIARHAYLIMCHQNYQQLCRLLKLLDDERNDIYLHIDRKSKDVPYEMIRNSLCHANLHFTKRMSVTWGSDSMIWCTLLLLKEAVKTEHAYYHLISGVDLPLKTQDEIHDFFHEHEGKEFITFDWRSNRTGAKLDRVRIYYFLQNFIVHDLQKIFVGMKRIFHWFCLIFTEVAQEWNLVTTSCMECQFIPPNTVVHTLCVRISSHL